MDKFDSLATDRPQITAARIRMDGLRAALLEVGSSLLPLPAGLTLDAAGVDPVCWTQDRMLARMGVQPEKRRKRSARDSMGAFDRRKRQVVARQSEALILQSAKVVGRLGYAKAARLLHKGIPLVGAVVAGFFAYRETTAIGFACCKR